MWEFLDRLRVARAAAYPRLPRSVAKQFDGNGNYTFGLDGAVDVPRDRPGQDRPRARLRHHRRDHGDKTDDEGRALLRGLGFPFKEN